MKINLPLCCPNCNKKYSRESSYNKHKLLCCNSSNTPLPILNNLSDLSGNQNIDNIKSTPILIQTVEELIKSNNLLKLEVIELKKQNQIQKRKIPIQDILKKTYTPIGNYTDYINSITILPINLETIFEKDIIIGIQEIICDDISKIESKECPIQAFNQKENKLFGYNNNKWEIISYDIWDKLILSINKKIVDEFKKWQDNHANKLYEEEFSNIYLNNVKKIMGGNISHEKISKKVYNILYTCLKVDIQSVEYNII